MTSSSSVRQHKPSRATCPESTPRCAQPRVLDTRGCWLLRGSIFHRPVPTQRVPSICQRQRRSAALPPAARGSHQRRPHRLQKSIAHYSVPTVHIPARHEMATRQHVGTLAHACTEQYPGRQRTPREEREGRFGITNCSVTFSPTKHDREGQNSKHAVVPLSAPLLPAASS